MSVCLLVLTDGRDTELEQTIASAEHSLVGPITRRIIHDDAGGVGHALALAKRYPDYEVVASPRVGFGGAIQASWEQVASGDEGFVFHLEGDFTFNRTVNLWDMMAVMCHEPKLAQMALVRQAWNEKEIAAGGLLQARPGEFEQVVTASHRWLRHRSFFTTNPALVPMRIVESGWPVVPQSEGMFSIDLFRDPESVCGFWGDLDQEPAVEHIGKVRVGTGY